jgi:hypothetical protein
MFQLGCDLRFGISSIGALGAVKTGETVLMVNPISAGFACFHWIAGVVYA